MCDNYGQTKLGVFPLNRPTLPSEAETRALMDACDAQAEAFLVSCVHFCQYMQTQVEFGLAHDILEGMKEETYARLGYYERRISEITGKEPEEPKKHEEQPRSATARFMR